MAIAFDAQSNNGTSGTGNSITLSHTCTGSDRILWVGVGIYDPSGGDIVTGVTYNGVAMTQVVKLAGSATEEIYLYYLINPATGANDIVASASAAADEFYVQAISYTGAKQSGQPDNTTTQGPTAGATSLTTTLTTVADNCWLIGMYASSGSAVAAGTGLTIRTGITSSRQTGDSNGAKTPAGSYGMTATASSSTMYGVMCSFSPSLPAVKRLLLLGVGV